MTPRIIKILTFPFHSVYLLYLLIKNGRIKILNDDENIQNSKMQFLLNFWGDVQTVIILDIFKTATSEIQEIILYNVVKKHMSKFTALGQIHHNVKLKH